MIGKCTDNIQVARTDFVERRDATGKQPFLVGDVKPKPLAYECMGTYTGREIIISLRVSVGFLGPEFITEDRIEIKPTFQRLECKRIVQLLSPWNVILL